MQGNAHTGALPVDHCSGLHNDVLREVYELIPAHLSHALLPGTSLQSTWVSGLGSATFKCACRACLGLTEPEMKAGQMSLQLP